MLFTLYGILTLTLCGGDAFHLVPRIIRAFKGSSEKIKRQIGIGIIILYAMSGNTGNLHMARMVAAIIISFGCYLPVTLLSKKKPKVGLLIFLKHVPICGLL